MFRLSVPLCLAAAALLAGCDQLGIESASSIAAQREAEGKAIGGACRNAGRAIEDCFALNRKADKAAMLAGWRDMNDYMRENKIEPTPPQLTPSTEVAKATEPAAEDAAKPAEKSADKAGDKPADKSDKSDKAEKADKADKPAESGKHRSS
jgi:hypothetical protein